MSQIGIVGAVTDADPRSDRDEAPGQDVSYKDVKGYGVKVNTALRFYHDVVGLDHLHYGLWNGDPRTLTGLKSAQERYAVRLADWLPDDVETVLDVGCGTGATTALLEKRGYEVEGLAPDPYQGVLFRRRTSAPFHLTRFQEFEPVAPFDLVLMSESAQYVWLPDLFPSVVRTGAGGWLLVSDYFRVSDGEGPHESSGHLVDEFLALAEGAGLVLVRREDVTDRVTPTLDLARGWIERYLEPTMDLLADRYPRLAKLGRWVMPSLAGKFRDLKVLVDSEEFARKKRYLILLFRIPSRIPG